MNQDHLISKYQEVIWREVLHCYDDETYIQKLLTLLPDDYENRTPQSIFRNRPPLVELETALYQVNKILSSSLAQKIWTKLLHRLRQSKNTPPPLQKLITQLNNSNWAERFIARHLIVYLGGETVLPLIDQLSTPDEEGAETIEWLLENIAFETSKELPKQTSRLICPNCLVKCGKNEVKMTRERTLTFYGCEICYQSRRFIKRPDQIVAVLDVNMKIGQKRNETGEILSVNWLKRKTLFEFDRVEIVNAPEEEVELFVIQVGNDGDKKRKSRYKKMTCTVHADCTLPENALRILDQMFGEIEWQNACMN